MARKGENIYKRKDGRWEGRYRIGFDETGKSKYRSVYAHSYQEIKEKLSKLKADAIKFISSGRVTVKALFDEWLSAVRLKVKQSTYANYLMKVKKHLLPMFGGLLYEKLTAKSVHEFIDKKLKNGLSAKYVSDIITVFKSMTKYISRIYGYHNPLENVILPKSEKKETVLLSHAEQEILSYTVQRRQDSTGIAVLLSYYTGLRIGEVCGLRWSDINFEKNSLTVSRTVQRITQKNGNHATHLLIGTPKSRTSVRTIPLPKFLMNILSKHKTKADAYILSQTASPVEPRTLQYRFKSLLKRANLPSVKFHALRHMFASNCIRLGFDVKTLSEILGHSAVETTLNRYVHASIEQKIACMNLLRPVA
ncbi:MAG: site-specific integrase [Oscillospiraceae bacterium]|nr:site-specific integrase [Oscillospiraceae bacterium]